jgi:hypothetical protein
MTENLDGNECDIYTVELSSLQTKKVCYVSLFDVYSGAFASFIHAFAQNPQDVSTIVSTGLLVEAL